METVELFREYQVAVDEERIAYERYERRVNLLGHGHPRTQAAADRHTCRERQRDELAANLDTDLVNDGWTFITDDLATLPPFSADERLVACHRRKDARIKRVIPLIRSQMVTGMGYWHYNVESHGKIGIEHWIPYAWREWPTPPPLPEVRGE